MNRLLCALVPINKSTVITLAAGAALVPAAFATTIVPLPVVNGGFEQVSISTSTEFGTGSGGPYATATGWTTNGYNFIYRPGTADSTGAAGQYGHLSLWGPANGANNGLPATSPYGGNFVAADGAFEVAAIKQVISGLTVGQQYSLSFFYAGAQQKGFDGATTEKWTVSLGSESYSTPVLNNVNHGFTGWHQADFVYTATATQETLSFLAAGTPNGEPPFSLLDGVNSSPTPSEVPEPSSFALLFTGMVGAGGFVRKRFRTPAA